MTSEVHHIKAAPYRLTAKDIKTEKCGGKNLKAGDTIYILDYNGEGYYDAWYKSDTFGCSFHENSEKIDGKYKTHQWLNVRYKDKTGWWLIPEACQTRNAPEWCPELVEVTR